jgi:hypothetical protein
MRSRTVWTRWGPPSACFSVGLRFFGGRCMRRERERGGFSGVLLLTSLRYIVSMVKFSRTLFVHDALFRILKNMIVEQNRDDIFLSTTGRCLLPDLLYLLFPATKAYLRKGEKAALCIANSESQVTALNKECCALDQERGYAQCSS